MKTLKRRSETEKTRELETAIFTTLGEVSSVLTPHIVCNPAGPSLFHSDFDNFDQNVNDLSGSGSVHITHGIIMQNVQQDEVASDPLIPSVPRTVCTEPFPERSFTYW